MVFITHNPHHGYPVCDKFLILNRGRSLGFFDKSEMSRDRLIQMMAGGQELDQLTHELEELARIGPTDASAASPIQESQQPE